MELSIIAAVSENNAIGIDNKIPWSIPDDLRYFKKITMGKAIIMGRNTFESLPGPLPGRTNIIVSRDIHYKHDGITVVNTLEKAIEAARHHASTSGATETMIVGGAQIYQQSLPLVNKMYLTRVYKLFDADTFFPDYDPDQWREIFFEEHVVEGKEKLKYAYTILERSLIH